MLSLDQVEKELKALDRSDAIFLNEAEPTLGEMVGFVVRERRRRELLVLRDRHNRGTRRCRFHPGGIARRH
jgi:hypothetical protein